MTVRMHHRWIWVAAAVLVPAAVVGALRFAPQFGVDQVAVDGNTQVTADQVLEAAAVDPGTPLVTLPVETIEQRVEGLDAVASASVERDWPNGVRITVHERRPVGYVRLSEGVGLVGSDGTVYRTLRRTPRELPELDGVMGAAGSSVAVGAGSSGAAVFSAAETLPTDLQRAVARIEVTGARQVLLTFDDGVVVTWGSTAAGEQKVAVLRLLRERNGWGRTFTAVDVSAPDAPALAS